VPFTVSSVKALVILSFCRFTLLMSSFEDASDDGGGGSHAVKQHAETTLPPLPGASHQN
jgi:hypothetical protein